jgi:hypothetical protein
VEDWLPLPADTSQSDEHIDDPGYTKSASSRFDLNNSTMREIPAIFRAAVIFVMFAYKLVFNAAFEIVPVEPIIALITTYDITSSTEPIIMARIEPTRRAVNALRLRYFSRNIKSIHLAKI